jgi:quercetin dioxygenase-like cupin family protein
LSDLVEFVEEVEGIYFRSILLPKAGMRVEQHQHEVSHPTYCGSGRAALFIDGKHVADVAAGHAIGVRANAPHLFVALEDNTRLSCIFDAARAQEIKKKGF